MSEGLYRLRVVCDIKDSQRAEVVNVERFEQWVVEIDACRAVNNDVHLRHEDLVVFRRHTQPGKHQVTSDRQNFLGPFLAHVRVRLKVRLEQFVLEDLANALLEGHAFLLAHHDVDAFEVGRRAHDLLKDDLADEASRAGYEKCFVFVEILDVHSSGSE